MYLKMSPRKTENREKSPALPSELEGLRFEDGLKKLEEALEALENDELPLEESIKKYEEGTKLYNFCRAKLESLERKVEILTRNAQTGELETAPYEREEAK